MKALSTKGKLGLGLTGGVLAVAAIGGGVFAQQLANVSAAGFSVGQATLSATCLNTATANVAFTTNPTFVNGAFEVATATLAITDGTNTIACNGIPVSVTAFDNTGAVLQTVSSTIVQPGASISQTITFSPALSPAQLNGYAINISG